jgi:hypothetical protein
LFSAKEKTMNETLHEFVTSRGVDIRVDREQGVIRGVKILGLESRNGRSYLPEALAAAVPLYEEAKVNVNHPKGDPLAPRDYQDRLGVIRHVTVQADGLFADLHFNPKHALAEQLIWDAEHAPENVGFSHNVQARTARRGQRLVVEAITKVQSVDLVADPATTRGLFEAAAQELLNEAAEAAAKNVAAENRDNAGPSGLASLTLEELRRSRPDLVDELLRQQAAHQARLEAELDRLQALEAVREKRAAVKRLLAEFHLPDPDTQTASSRAIVSPRFLESLMAAPDEPQMRALVEERANLLRDANLAPPLPPSRPLAREQHQVDAPRSLDAKTFVQAIT